MNSKINNLYDFVLLENNNFYFNEFRKLLNQFLWFVQSAPIQRANNVNAEKFIQIMKIRTSYFRLLYEIFSDLLNVYPHIKDVNFTLYPELRKLFQLTDLEVYSAKGADITTWSHPYWEFLHWTSICVYIKFTISGGTAGQHAQIIEKFAAMLINLNFVLLCGNCVQNYNNLNLDPLIATMLQTNDPITAVYNLHNMVTTKVAISNRRISNDGVDKSFIIEFPFTQFETNYKIKKRYHPSTSSAMLYSDSLPPQNFQKRLEHRQLTKLKSAPYSPQNNVKVLAQTSGKYNDAGQYVNKLAPAHTSKLAAYNLDTKKQIYQNSSQIIEIQNDDNTVEDALQNMDNIKNSINDRPHIADKLHLHGHELSTGQSIIQPLPVKDDNIESLTVEKILTLDNDNLQQRKQNLDVPNVDTLIKNKSVENGTTNEDNNTRSSLDDLIVKINENKSNWVIG